MKRLKAILPHVCIVTAMMFPVFLVLDSYNPMMNFIDNPLSHALLMLLCLSSILSSLFALKDSRDREEQFQDRHG